MLWVLVFYRERMQNKSYLRSDKVVSMHGNQASNDNQPKAINGINIIIIIII